MTRRTLFVAAALVALSPASFVRAQTREIVDAIDGRVVQVELPLEDVGVMYVESASGMLVELNARTARVSGRKFYIGDGKIALEVKVEHPRGIVFQGQEDLIGHGTVFKKYSVIEVLPGYKKASQLGPGDVYVQLRGMNWKLPEE